MMCINQMPMDLGAGINRIFEIDSRDIKRMAIMSNTSNPKKSLNQNIKSTTMKKYTFSFWFLKEETKQTGTVSLVAVNLLNATKLFERMYCERDSCSSYPKAELNGVKLNITSVIESDVLDETVKAKK